MHFLQQFGCEHFHAVEGEPLLAEVFDAGTEVIDSIVDAEEAVVRAIKGDNIYWSVLRMVLLNIQLQLCGWFFGIDGSSHLVCSFGEHGEHAVVYIVVNEDNSCGGFAYTVVDEGVGIEDLSIVEDTLVGR